MVSNEVISEITFTFLLARRNCSETLDPHGARTK